MSQQKLVASILDLGELLLMSGAEVNRIEDTIERIGEAYGFVRTDVFTITSSIVLTVQTKEGDIVTQTRRIKAVETNLAKVEEINRLSREICETRPEVSYMESEIAKIKEVPEYSEVIIGFAYAMIAAVFSIFFGGNIMDAVASAIGALVIRFVLRNGQRVQMNPIILSIICSGASGIVAMVLASIGVGQSIDKIIIGNIMLLIPGIAFTTALRDMIKGDIISGLLQLSEALLRAIAVAIGFLIIWFGKGGL